MISENAIVNPKPIEVPEPSPPYSWGSQLDSTRDENITNVSLKTTENESLNLSSTQPNHDDVRGNHANAISNEEDEDFTVHFVHHGRKSTEPISDKMDLLQQINELHEVVGEMKGSLTEAMTKLGGVVEDSNINQRLDETSNKCETNSAEILKLVLSVKSDVSSVMKEISEVKERQSSLHKAVNILLEDRRSLATDLSQAGVISNHTRTRLECVTGVVEAIGVHRRSASGSHSNDSGVAHLLEKAHNVFADDIPGGAGQRSSDQDSLPDHPSLLVPSSVYDYVAGLSQPSYSLQSSCTYCPSLSPENSASSTNDINDTSLKTDEIDSGVVYDSDSSITIAANKTLSLSTCLSQEIRVKEGLRCSVNQMEANTQNGKQPSSNRTKGNFANRRQRKPLLGISSTAMYQPTYHSHSSNGEKEKTTHYHKHRHKKDPQETQRYKVARELLDTEKKYCKTLWTIQETFAEPLKKATILSNEDVTTLFPDEVYQLYDKHCLLQHQLRERLGSWKWHPVIGDILSRFTDPNQSEILRLYTNYVNYFPDVLKTFHRLCKTSQSFTNFIRTCLEQPACGGLDLGAFLLSPVQRVPRYILLMKQLLKYTESTHPDYQQLNICLDRLRDFLVRLNYSIEHSFRLVNSSLSSTAGLKCGMINSVSEEHQRHSDSSQESVTNSPQGEIYNGQQSVGSEENRSPQRSLSSASQIRNDHMPSGRSASLPRTCSSESPVIHREIPDKGYNTYDKHRSRFDKRRLLTVLPDPADQSITKCRPLTSARSATDVTQGVNDTCKYGDLAASEPSLIDSNLKCLKHDSSESRITSASRSTTPKLVTWTDSVNSMEDCRSRKKASIKTSIKNMFWFKRRRINGKDKDEQIYWPTSISDITHMHNHSTLSTAFSTSLKPIVGDFVDEEGNPCSNV